MKRSPQSRFYPGIWDLFGGHVEEEGSSEDALRCEALEELQVEIESFRLLGTVHDPAEPAENKVFAVLSWSGEAINAAPDEHSQIGWFEADSLPEAPFECRTRSNLLAVIGICHVLGSRSDS